MQPKNKEFRQAFRRQMKYLFHHETFDWKTQSVQLAAKFSKYFDIWWDPNKWCGHANILMRHCNDHFDKWWPTHGSELTQYELVVFCGKHFMTWYPDYDFKFDNKFMMYLETHCKEFQHIWFPDAIVVKLINE